MAKPTKIAHPLKNRKGTSQRTRIINALKPENAPIDGRSLADQLFLISEYARQINYYEFKQEADQEYQELTNWTAFFNDSLPFQLSVFSKLSIEETEKRYLSLHNELVANPSKHTLDVLLSFFFEQLIVPVDKLFDEVAVNKNSFEKLLRSVLESFYRDPLLSYIKLSNASATFLCSCKRNFTHFLKDPWRFNAIDIYDLEVCIQQSKKGKREAFLKAADLLNDLFYKFFGGLRQIVEKTADYVEESIHPLEEAFRQKQLPHLALLFTFLELFKHFRSNLNTLTKDHLDFFYREVLKLQPKNAIPDKAHIVFEIAKHLEQYPIPKDLLLKDGKDNNKQDIQFGLDHELVLDKAQITDLKTLALPRVNYNDGCYIEGLYTAPKANSKDGLGLKFKKEEPLNWYTLGNKWSKCPDLEASVSHLNSVSKELCNEVQKKMKPHPDARIGFVLASPVLYLQEGKRTVNMLLECAIGPDSEIQKKSCENTSFGTTEFLNKIGSMEGVFFSKVYAFSLDALNTVLGGFSFTPKARKHINNTFHNDGKNVLYSYELDDFLNKRSRPDGAFILRPNEKTKLRTTIRGFEFIARGVPNSLFSLIFSGQEEWLKVNQSTIRIHAWEDLTDPTSPKLLFDIKTVLEPDFPAIDFYNAEVLKEKIDLKQPFPLVKVLLNPIKLDCDADRDEKSNECCLKNKEKPSKFNVSSYHYLRRLQLVNSTINVSVCGVKNLIVQNDENLQDVNKPIFPFGPRPKVGDNWQVSGGANFFIGSKEIFCKNWQKFWINTEWKDKPQNLHEHYRFYRDPEFENGDPAITNLSFRFLTSLLHEGNWITDIENNNIPSDPVSHDNTLPIHDQNFTQNYVKGDLLPFFTSVFESPKACVNFTGFSKYMHQIDDSFFTSNGYNYVPKTMPVEALEPLTVNTRKGFVKLTLTGTSFQHQLYTFVLTRQMMALADLADPKSVEEAIDELEQSEKLCEETPDRFQEIQDWSDSLNDLKDEIKKHPLFNVNIPDNVPNNLNPWGLQKIVESICRRTKNVKEKFDNEAVSGIPEEPYTPVIRSLSLDYEAIADKKDIDIIHLYPFDNTSKHEDILNKPTLFPYFDDEGTLYIGIENITAGGQLSILFQLAETTADSETDRAKVEWAYLSSNAWKPMREGFEVISDESDGLTVSGIVTLAVPDDISNHNNTIMPDGLFWIKVSANQNVQAIAEVIGIHTQAARSSARLNSLNDTSRLGEELPAKKISKLAKGDFSIKEVAQPYPSFGGRIAEESGHFYTRISEHLKHKGRGIGIHDYEKLTLEHFPEIYKAKCISHTMGLSAHRYERDLEIAPGYIVVAVIPDLTKLKSGGQLEPKVPISLLERIAAELRKRVSPFSRFKVMNPRYEYIDVNIEVRLYRGKAVNFYQQQLIDDLMDFFAPWHLGDSEKLSFGQNVHFSDVVGFVEQLDYVDFITDLVLTSDEDKCIQTGTVIKPLTARSILTGGKICVTINEEDCRQRHRTVEPIIKS